MHIIDQVRGDIIQEFITTAFPNGYPQKEMSFVIKEVKSQFPTADGKLIAQLVKEHIQ